MTASYNLMLPLNGMHRSLYRILTNALGAAAIAAVALGAGSCGDSPSGPTRTATLQPPNTPPVISSLTTSRPRIEAGDQVQVTAAVSDDVTPVDKLTYKWGATPVAGTFTGSGRQVSWQAPRSQKTPDTYTLTLTASDTYRINHLPAQSSSSANVQIHYNDSPAEITAISLEFLTKLFPDYTVPAAQAVHNFSDNCPGKAAEFSDVSNNRINFHILDGTYAISSIDLNADRTFANISGVCVFHDIPVSTGTRETVTGICRLTSVYENWHWLLCDSHFDGISIVPTATGPRLGVRFMKP